MLIVVMMTVGLVGRWMVEDVNMIVIQIFMHMCEMFVFSSTSVSTTFCFFSIPRFHSGRT